MELFSIFLHVIIMMIGLFVALLDYKLKNNKKLSVFMGANLVFIFIYGLIPIVMITNNFFVGKTDFYLVYMVDQNKEPYLFTAVLIIIGYLSMILGYYFSKPYRKKIVNVDVPEKFLRTFGFLLLVVSTISTLYIASSLGGILNSLKYITELREGETNVTSSIFLLLPLSIAAFLIFLSLQLKEFKWFSVSFLFLIVSFINSLYYVLIYGGRLPLALFLFILPMYYMDKHSKFNIKNMTVILIIGILLLNYLESFFDMVSGSEFATSGIFDNIPRLFAQFSFPYINSLKVHGFTYNNGEFRYFVDLISWVINYIPKNFSNFIGLKQIPPSYVVNSQNHLTTGIPTDIITFGYYQFALPGVIIITFLFGSIIGFFDKFLNTFNENVFIILAKVRIFQIISFFPMYADFEAFMRRRIDVVVIIFILILFSVRKGKVNQTD